MKALYNTILDRIKTQVPEIKMIDFEMGQIESLINDQRPSVLFPCCLVDIDYLNCDDETDTTQQVEARVTLKFAFQQQNNTDSLATSAKRNAGLLLFDTIEKAHTALQGYSTNEFSKFSRRAMTPDRRFVGIKIIDVVYETTFEE